VRAVCGSGRTRSEGGAGNKQQPEDDRAQRLPDAGDDHRKERRLIAEGVVGGVGENGGKIEGEGARREEKDGPLRGGGARRVAEGEHDRGDAGGEDDEHRETTGAEKLKHGGPPLRRIVRAATYAALKGGTLARSARDEES
jgi:hypothetical protein